MSPSKFITLEGIDGAGKSTQLEWITQYFESKGIPLVVTREPGGTPLGEELRHCLLNKDWSIHAETEALLMFAARREHLHQVILPSLANGNWVISDRFTDASFAYQGGGRQLEHTKLEILEKWVSNMIQPDLTLYLDVPPILGKERTSRIKPADRFEKEQQDFFERVRSTYIERAHQYPERIQVIDASQSLEAVQQSITQSLQNLLKI